MTRSWPRARNVLRTRQGRILRPSSSPRSFSARQRYTYWMTSVGSGSVHELVKGDGFGARRGGPEASGCFITQFLGRDSDMVEAREAFIFGRGQHDDAGGAVALDPDGVRHGFVVIEADDRKSVVSGKSVSVSVALGGRRIIKNK